MKKVSIASLIVLLFVVAGCKKEKEDTPKDNKAKMLGKWKMEKHITENYQPADVLKYFYEESGKSGDYCIFNKDNTIDVYLENKFNGTVAYNFINDSTVILDKEPFVIRKLTNTEMYLYQETADPNGYWKEIISVYWVR